MHSRSFEPGVSHAPRPALLPPRLSREQAVERSGGGEQSYGHPPAMDGGGFAEAARAGDGLHRQRAALPSAAEVLPLIEIVARGISGAAGYAFIGEDPAAAGVRFGMLGLRQDSGDMGAVFMRAHQRDPVAFMAALGADADALLAHLTGPAPKASFRGQDLWAAPYKHVLSAAAATPNFTAAQNEHAVEGVFQTAVHLLHPNPALGTGVPMAMALDVLAECGVDKGRTVLAEVLSADVPDGAAFQSALAKAVPGSARRFAGLVGNPRLRNWRLPQAGAV